MAASAASLSWEDIRLFAALIAQEGKYRSLAEASRGLGVDASTLSRRLARLEESLETPLFLRSTRGLVPGPAAEELAPIATEMLRAANRFGRAPMVGDAVDGEVRIACPPGLAESFLAPLLPRLLSLHPGLRIILDSRTEVVDLAAREADLALRTIKPEKGPLRRVRLRRTASSIFVAPSRIPLKPLRKLADIPWVGWPAGTPFVGARWLEKAAPEVVPVLRTSQFSAQLAAARAGAGAILAPDAYAPVWGLAPLPLAAALLKKLPAFPVDELWLVVPEGLAEVPRVALVHRFLVEVFRGDLPPSISTKP
jgi:DNA-binding transcriptional LysR family regulator